MHLIRPSNRVESFLKPIQSSKSIALGFAITFFVLAYLSGGATLDRVCMAPAGKLDHILGAVSGGCLLVSLVSLVVWLVYNHKYNAKRERLREIEEAGKPQLDELHARYTDDTKLSKEEKTLLLAEIDARSAYLIKLGRVKAWQLHDKVKVELKKFEILIRSDKDLIVTVAAVAALFFMIGGLSMLPALGGHLAGEIICPLALVICLAVGKAASLLYEARRKMIAEIEAINGEAWGQLKSRIAREPNMFTPLIQARIAWLNGR